MGTPSISVWENVVNDLKEGSSHALECVRSEFIHPLRFLSYVVTEDMFVSKLIVNNAILEMWVFRENIKVPQDVKIFLYEEVARASFLFHLKSYWGITDRGEQVRIWNEEGGCIKEVIKLTDEYQTTKQKVRTMLKAGAVKK